MRLNYLFYAIGLIIKYIGITLLIPIVVALYYKDFYSVLPFLSSGILSIIAGCGLKKLGNLNGKIENLNDIKKSEALFVVAISWIIFGILTALPFLFYGIDFTDALFESVSGITTTGATILTHFNYPKTMFFWRSFTQWLGGMGIVVLFIAVLPKFSVAGRQMFSAESPGPVEEKITPRIRHTASWLWAMYISLTVAQIILLKFFGMDFYNAICNSMSTVSTGGLSPNAQSIMGYNNSKITLVVLIFMFLSGANFILQYKVFIQRKWKELLKSEEFFTYLVLVIFFSITIAFFIQISHQGSFLNNLLNSAFNTVSIITSTGFASCDFIKWSTDAKTMLFAAMFSSACAASTSGGLKIIRWIFLFKYIKREVAKIIHPSAVYPIKLEGRAISTDIAQQMMAFCVFYFFIFALSAFVVGLIEKNPAVAVSGSITTLGNIGPGLSAKIGPMGSFDCLALSTKWIFIFNMLIGRLELIPFLALLHKDLWTKN